MELLFWPSAEKPKILRKWQILGILTKKLWCDWQGHSISAFTFEPPRSLSDLSSLNQKIVARRNFYLANSQRSLFHTVRQAPSAECAFQYGESAIGSLLFILSSLSRFTTRKKSEKSSSFYRKNRYLVMERPRNEPPISLGGASPFDH